MSRAMSRTAAAVAALVLAFGAATAPRAQESAPPPPPMKAGDGLFPFVLPWDDASPGVVDVSGLLPRPAGKAGTIRVEGGHFYAGRDRIRFLGVNLCFGADFPTHEAAEKVAARMARFGINCVRFHHMDTSVAPDGLVKADRKTLDPERLDRLDYLIARLKERGIYANLNLHVGRKYPDRPDWPGAPGYFKGVDNFDAAMIRDQKDYAVALLRHVNPYTKAAYADEPAVAIVEINNENALFNEWSGDGLEAMTDPYSSDLQRRWNAFLTSKYKTDAAMRKAWSVREVPRGREMLKNGSFGRGDEGWAFEQHSGKARHEVAGGRLTLTVEEPAEQSWHIQFNQPGLHLKADTPYTLRFRARASEPVRLALNAMQAHAPWKPLWNVQQELTTEWKDVELVFRAAEADENGRVTFSGVGDKKVALEVDDVSLAPGGVMGLRHGEALGKIPWFRHREFGVRTPEAQADWIRFLWELEDEYWSGMSRFVKEGLGVKCVVIGTQMGWSPAPVQARLDAIDSHSYWQHPHFPRRPWDENDWTIENIPMAGRPDGGTLPRLGLSRVVGKPFLCTEYNHAAPNTYGAEGALLLAAYAARQDWDAIFLFAYSHRGGDDWGPGKITSFFDIDQHPAKMATLPAAAAIFLRGDVPRAAKTAIARPKPADWIEAGRLRGAWGLGGEAFGLTTQQALTHYVGVALDDAAPARSPDLDEPGAFAWTPGPDAKTGRVTIDARRSKALIGSTKAGPARLGEVTIDAKSNRQDWAAITLTAIDGPDFRSPGRILLTATGDAGNVGMKWRDAARTTLGRDWGDGPSLVEGIPADVTLPAPAAKVSAWPLDERGRRRGDAPLKVEAAGDGCRISIGPGSKTLWYEIEVAR
ncbi:carbohydrate binding domain-containing protein [Paludisphaera mucosa]|uniref:Carbohydrate binding domain-containing protein n=1 Tax=Paludisphaera mucosa TaxID=3030827 RepID=A0ABT6FBW6_9BACT|nr:carbohydrate binding domain-containing protein [Paludisphaera mucosa]MDG3004870.1 carbohydrate binding domain-containing protein [Paludisphaera mucosa]